MCFLARNIFSHRIGNGFANCERSIPPLPRKFGLMVLPYPFGGASCQLSHNIGKGDRGILSYKQVHVVGRPVYSDEFAAQILDDPSEVAIKLGLPRFGD